MAPVARTARVLVMGLLAVIMTLAGVAPSRAADAAETGASPGGTTSAPSTTVPERADDAAGGTGNARNAGEQPAAGEQSSNTEVFVPSEEISEDFTVSFPVDI